jgi:hypothetical protein
MKMMYAANGGAGPTYEIEADRQGNFTIRREGRLLKRVSSVSNYVGKPRWGSKRLELAAVEDAKNLIDTYHAQEA